MSTNVQNVVTLDRNNTMVSYAESVINGSNWVRMTNIIVIVECSQFEQNRSGHRETRALC